MNESKDGTALAVDFGYWPGRIVSGRGAVARLGEVVGQVGGKRALVICGSTVARTDMLGKVKAGLGERLASVFPEVKSHTPVEMVERCLGVFHDSGADTLVTVGGGSAIDAGKALQIRLATDGGSILLSCPTTISQSETPIICGWFGP